MWFNHAKILTVIEKISGSNVNSLIIFVYGNVIMDRSFITVCLALLLIHVGAEFLFDEYAGPYEQKPLGSELCRITGRSCGEVKFTRRKLPGRDDWDWLYNVSIRNFIYMKETTTLQIVASTKGASGHYNSLADITRPACKWLDMIEPFVNDLSKHAGYKPEVCLSVFPSLYQVTNFHFKSQSHFRMISKFPIAPYGIYKIEFRLSEKDNHNCYCYQIYVELVPDAKLILKKQRQNQTSSLH